MAQKIGQQHARAMLAQGWEELRSVATPTATQVQAATQPGLVGTITQGEITNDRVQGGWTQKIEAEKEQQKEQDNELSL